MSDSSKPEPSEGRRDRRNHDRTIPDHRPSQWLTEFMVELGPIHEALDLPDLYAGIARAVIMALGADACLISVLDDDRDVLRDVAASVRPPTQLNRVAESYLLDGFPVTREVLRSGDPVEISLSDPHAHPTETRFLHELDFQRVLIHPLTIEGANIGTVEVYREEDRPFRFDDPKQIALITSYASTAHSRIRLTSQVDLHYTATIAALASALEARDPETNAHTGRIKDYAVALAEAMQVPPDVRRSVMLGSLLHDVGKIGIRDSILLKPGPLSPEEWSIMRTHPAVGEKMLSGVEFLRGALPVVRHHHERWDGAGYPDGLARHDIPIGARIVAVCDAFDAMTSDRPYRRAAPVDEATQTLLQGARTQWDPDCVGLLVDVIQSFGDGALNGAFVRYAS
jgi:HD-GYP domain-containing protein (c-di-GMP phosphodiesterase class II)